MAFVPENRMEPPPRNHVADAYGCIMVRAYRKPAEYKAVARFIAPDDGFPSDRMLVHLALPQLAGGLGMLRVKARAHARPLRGEWP